MIFSELAIQYNLHLEHILHARNKFEEEVRDFNEQLMKSVSKILSKRTELLTTIIRYDEPDDDVSSKNVSKATSYKAGSTTVLRVKKPGSKVFQNFGSFNIIIECKENRFSWCGFFENTDILSESIDEICKEKIIEKEKIEEKNPVFKNWKYYAKTRIDFFRYPIDMEFPKNFDEVLTQSIDLLMGVVESIYKEKLNETEDNN